MIDISAQRPRNPRSPRAFEVRHTLQGHRKPILRITWSPDGSKLASASIDQTIRLWNADTGECLHMLTVYRYGVNQVAWSPDGSKLASVSFNRDIQVWNADTGKQELLIPDTHSKDVVSVAWSPDGQTLVSCSVDGTIQFWNTNTWERKIKLLPYGGEVYYVVWSPDGKKMASCFEDGSICIWNPESGELLKVLKGHSSKVICIVWSCDGHTLASASFDKTIRLWHMEFDSHIRILTGHTAWLRSVSFSSDTRLLASNSHDGTVRLWCCDTWEMVKTRKEPVNSSEFFVSSLAFHPREASVLAIPCEYDTSIQIMDLNTDLLKSFQSKTSTSYTNAKVVLVGDSGVGKSALGLVLSEQPFVPTDSTHGRRVWSFDHNEVRLTGRNKEKRETLLWDLAGQPGYRLIHQLHLDEAAIALIVFDNRNESDPFGGVRYWARALDQAQPVTCSADVPLKKFLVAARIDRGGVGVSRTRIETLVSELHLDGYFETSAKSGLGIKELRQAIKERIEWDKLPKVSSTKLFESIKAFLLKKKENNYLLPVGEIYQEFLSRDRRTDTKDLQAEFKTCIELMESRDLIRRLSFGNLVLLQPELLDAYASALLIAVKDEPDGLGCIAEDRVRLGDFRMPSEERLIDKEQEKLLLITLIEDLLRRELALHEESFLVFPSQSTREKPDLPDPKGKAVIFDFQGPVLNIYATLAVRLSYSQSFKKKELWRNAVTYTASAGGVCGMFLQQENIHEGQGKLTLFFDEATSEQTRFHFEEYVATHLERHAVRESIRRHRIIHCPTCNTAISEQITQARLSFGHKWLRCPVCDKHISLLDGKERLIGEHASLVVDMDIEANRGRDQAAAKLMVEGKIETKDFDVFLCHNDIDKPAVKKIGEQLKERGILPWLDEWELRPGLPWQPLLEEQIGQIKSVAVFIGKIGRGPWQNMELYAFLQQYVHREQKCPVIPVLLPDCENVPDLPSFLNIMTLVDFCKQDPDPIERLIWGITGER